MSKASFIPFITGQQACDLASEFFGDAPMVRVPLEKVETLDDYLPPVRRWVDAGVDGLDNLAKSTPKKKDAKDKKAKPDPRQPWYDRISSFEGFEEIADPAFQASPKKGVVADFVAAALDACVQHKATAVSVPQLPHVDGSERNKINKVMAAAAAGWQVEHPKVTLILPVILNHPKHSSSKTQRNSHVKLAAQCLAASKAQGCWIVDASLNDEEQSATLRRDRLAGMIKFHEEFNAATANATFTRIAGPYWALNLLLWSRGLVDRVGIGAGTGFRYHLAGGFPSKGTARIAIPPLYRRAKTGVELKNWITDALKAIEPTHPFSEPLTKLKPLAAPSQEAARRQTATFYRGWIDMLAATPAPGRAMALFQALSIAFSYGKQIQAKLDAEGTTRRPESIAEALMLNCL